VPIRDSRERLAGTEVIAKPGAEMATLAPMTARGRSAAHVVEPARRPAAILFADLEASSPFDAAHVDRELLRAPAATWSVPATSASSTRAA
jgi:hypothetical protein